MRLRRLQSGIEDKAFAPVPPVDSRIHAFRGGKELDRFYRDSVVEIDLVIQSATSGLRQAASDRPDILGWASQPSLAR